jgi:hypothetical protein
VAAWDDHVAQWMPSSRAESYLNAEQYRQLLVSKSSDDKNTLQNFDFEKMAGNVDVFCPLSFQEINGKLTYVHDETMPAVHCPIRAVDANGNFEVQVFVENDQEYFIYSGMPLYALAFRDKEYTSDFHLRNAFRHEIGLPEGVFPNAWKNLPPPTKRKKSRSISEQMNDRISWVKTLEELKTDPYPEGVQTVCLLYLDQERIAKDEQDQKTIEWSFNRSEKSPKEVPCDILSRHFSEDHYYPDEIFWRAESVKPLPVHYNATVFFHRSHFNVTGIPRHAIHFR